MEDEIEDLVGDVKNTDSQKSVATSNVYSMDFTDSSSSDKHNSSGKETYVIECDDSEVSEESFILNCKQSVVNLIEDPVRSRDMNCETCNRISKSTSASFQYSIAQEIFTQTSKTIVQLAETEGIVKKIKSNSLETQTSFISVSAEKKCVEYKIQISDSHHCFIKNLGGNGDNLNYEAITSVDDESTKYPKSETENSPSHSKDDVSSNERILDVIEDEYLNEITSECNDENEIEQESCEKISTTDTDIEEDSLQCNEYSQKGNCCADANSETSEVTKSVDGDIEELYTKLSEKMKFNIDKSCEQDKPRYSTLSPLTEETATKNESIVDITPDCNSTDDSQNDKYFLFQNNAGTKFKVLPNDDKYTNHVDFKLPPIKRNQSCPNSPRLNFLFSNKYQDNRSNIIEEREELLKQFGDKDLAAGECARIDSCIDPRKTPKTLQLPPIRVEKNHNFLKVKEEVTDVKNIKCYSKKDNSFRARQESISIKDKIRELKMSNNTFTHSPQERRTESKTSRSGSPYSVSPESSRPGDIAERGCDALCLELLRRLRSSSWIEVCATLEEVPHAMGKFWGVISENRIADLIRQVSSHIESPRTQVARTACNTLANILKNTNYTKKPDFYEAVTTLLTKTGSFNRPVRRAANVALDGIVCSVELTHAVTALCVHGTSHKSPLVRCAAARLLVVCCALAGGGRELLRTRPQSAVSARRHALTALSVLLEDRSLDTRKYAERLYSMLRPLHNFEAFYLTDVDIETASRQMLKYDQLLLCGQPKATR